MTISARHMAHQLLRIDHPVEKARRVRQLDLDDLLVLPADTIADVPGLPGRPERPTLVPPQQLKPGSGCELAICRHARAFLPGLVASST